MALSQPLQALAVRPELHAVRTLQPGRIDDTDDVLRNLRTLGDYSQLGVEVLGSRIEVHRTDVDPGLVDHRCLGMQTAERHAREYVPRVAPQTRKTELVEL